MMNNKRIVSIRIENHINTMILFIYSFVFLSLITAKNCQCTKCASCASHLIRHSLWFKINEWNNIFACQQICNRQSAIIKVFKLKHDRHDSIWILFITISMFLSYFSLFQNHFTSHTVSGDTTLFNIRPIHHHDLCDHLVNILTTSTSSIAVLYRNWCQSYTS